MITPKLIRRKPLKHVTVTSRWQRKRKPVTICIAAICQSSSGDVIVTASDRMVTLGGKTEYVWREQTKTYWFTDFIVSLSADDPDLALEVETAAYRSLEKRNGTLTVKKVAYKVAQKFREHRARRNEQLILSPQGLTFQTLMQNEKALDPTNVKLLRDRLDEGALRATMIIAGLDKDNEGHIFVVDDPGVCVTCDSEGFAAIGLGREHAEVVFAEANYTPYREWTEALIISYLAKRRAEAAPGVGNVDTDLYWIRSEGRGYAAPADPLLGQLGKIERDLSRNTRRVINRGHEQLKSNIETVPLHTNCAISSTDQR
jgi:hypothetical protein